MTDTTAGTTVDNTKLVTEEELKARSVYPRVTSEDLDANIVREIYVNPEGTTLTLCVLELKNGYTVTGESACADPANYKKDLGERLARTDAYKKIWGLMGYALRDRLQIFENSTAPSTVGTKTYIGTKIVHAVPMTRAEYNLFRDWTLPADENGDDEGYLVEYADGGQSNIEGWTGYVSWSPKAIFEGSYHEISGAAYGPEKTPSSLSYLDRLKNELKDLREKHGKLVLMMADKGENAIYPALPRNEQQLLTQQRAIMQDYIDVLERRLQLAPAT